MTGTAYLALTKWKVIFYLQGKSKGILNKIVNCVLCTCFWLSCIFAITGLIFGAPLVTILSPLASASLARSVIG